MKRALLLAIVAVVACSSWGRETKTEIPELKTQKVFGDSYETVDDMIGFYKGFSIDWPTSMRGMDITSIQNAVGKFALDDKYNKDMMINDIISDSLDIGSSLPVPQKIHKAFYNCTDFSWLWKDEKQSFHFELTLVQLLDKGNGAYFSYDKSYTYFFGGVSHVSHNYLIYDLVNNKEMEWEDIFTKNSENAIIRIIVGQVMKDNKVKTYSELADKLCMLVSDDDLPPRPEEVAYKKGIFIFTYNPYEVACGAAGNITVTIPAKKLSRYMTSKAKIIFGVK